MSSDSFRWESLLNTDAPKGCSLKAALFTTYDRPDERLLAEHLLPVLLKLNREPGGEGAERQYFLLELDRRLKQLHNQIVVVSSTAREEPGDWQEVGSGTYGWIWRSIRHLTVGCHRKAVQHAKVWLLNWGASKDDEHGDEYLELVVSSTNLTLAALKGQLQEAWRVCVKLHPRPSEARLARWGVLPDFLRELAASAGDATRLVPFAKLLARADCPEGITFIASVPGTHSRQALRRTPWGAAGLGKVAPCGRGKVNVSILSPFIGSWTAEALSRWCATFESSPNRLELVWIDRNHPWARAERWMLPKGTLNTLTRAGATILHLRHEPDGCETTDVFHEEHRPGDNRWSHAKVYSIKRGNSRRLLVTSANFSTAAWGRANRDGELTIENFELGVCVDRGVWRRFEDLEVFQEEESVATVSELPSRGQVVIAWARAVWNGKNVVVDCRCEATRKLKGDINPGCECKPIVNWTVRANGLRSARVPWVNTAQPPSLVRLTCEHEMMNVPVFDERSLREREDTLPPEVDANLAETMRDELLFEQYGGRVAAGLEDEPSTAEGQEPEVPPSEDPKTRNVASVSDSEEELEEAGAGRSDSYDIPAFVLARQRLRVVDNWGDQVKQAVRSGTEEFERNVLRRDGQLLIEAFQRQAARDDKKGLSRAIGSRLAVEELALRLKYFPEA